MRVKLVDATGFCMGVQRAVNITLKAADKGGSKIYTYGPLIHNPQVIELLKGKGIEIISDLQRLHSGIVVIRAHGIAPQKWKEIKETGAQILDATCPRVTRVQKIIRQYATQGYATLIVGDKEHAEVVGLLGFSRGKGFVVTSEEDVAELPDLRKVCVVAQTTQNEGRFDQISRRVKERYAESLIFNTICDSTQKRQEETLELARQVEGMVVVGGKNSGNTLRLVKISESTGTPTFFIEHEDELDMERLKRLTTVGVVGGTSTPLWILERVVKRIEEAGTGD
jgi:4-hydroxy-3-methylbut-2-enyl diphosphate reductase